MYAYLTFVFSDLLSTKYKEPVPCGPNTFCDFGATCSSTEEYDRNGNLLRTCLCEIDCSLDHQAKPLEKLLVCASDGNTYRSECHLRQHSCRIQKEMKIVNRGSCPGNGLKYEYLIKLFK